MSSSSDLQKQIVKLVGSRKYKPLKPKALARQLGLAKSQYAHFRRELRELLNQGRVLLGKNHTVRVPEPHGTITGIFRRVSPRRALVRPHPGQAAGILGDVVIPRDRGKDASTDDEVLVKVVKRPAHGKDAVGEIVQILTRATRQFVGTYFERDEQGYVRVAGTVFSHSVWVGDPGAKGAVPDDQVVIEIIRFPHVGDRGEAVITEVIGRKGDPGVDTLTVIRAFGIPDTFSDEALAEARGAAETFDETDLADRTDFTDQLVITIDPVDARDFDDAIALSHDPDSGHWQLCVHIADVSHFVSPDGQLDKEARSRGTSVYLPRQVIPMLPEVISNGLASLQEGRLRYVKTAVIDYSPDGQRTDVRFHNGAIRVRKRFTYEQVLDILEKPQEYGPDRLEPEILELLLRMRELAMMLRERRRRRGALELTMPEAVLEYDEEGRVKGAHFATDDISHQVIEEFMLAANEAVADFFRRERTPTLRRIHPPPNPIALGKFAEFARVLGYTIRSADDRFQLQRVLNESASRSDAPAVHFALLRSLKKATYSPDEEEHYALAIDHYCHFTSPIRRYPDLIVHRMLGQWLRRHKVSADKTELVALGTHCSRAERRAEQAERELVKLKLLTYLSERIGMTGQAVITGVADYGFYAQFVRFPVEGMVHVSTLVDDYYHFDEATHTLSGKRSRRRYRLGDSVTVEVVRVDLARRLLDLRLKD